MICKKCSVDKPENEFYKSDKTCKECRKEMVRANRLANIEYYREYDRNRFKNDPRVKERIEKYIKTANGKAVASKAKKKWQENNKIKRAAHVITGNAIRDGHLKKESCEVCGCANVHAHHDDYLYPLAVRWLCPKHHKEWHDINGEGKNA